MKTVYFHIDVNSAFLSWSAIHRLQHGEKLDIRTIPSVVGGNEKTRHGIILAKSIPAKKFGIKNEVRDILGFTVNVGVSSNKLLAKMASEFQKPDKMHTLWLNEVEEKMWPLPVSELYMVGRKMSIHLRRKGIYIIGQLATSKEEWMIQTFKSFGDLLWQFANGQYQEESNGGSAFFQGMMTHNDKHKIKGIGNSGTMPIDVTELAMAHQALLSICETVGYRLRKHGFCSKIIHVSFTTNEFERVSKQHKFGAYTNITSEIYIRACQLFDELWDGKKRIRQLGVRATDLKESNVIQGSIFSPIEEQLKNQRVDIVVDCIREKYGNQMILRGQLYNGKITPMIGGTWGTASWRPKGGMPSK